MASAQAGPLAAPGLDGQFVRINRQVPGFGGYFFDENGDLNVYLTVRGNESAARAAVAGAARNRSERSQQPWARPAQVLVKRAEFEFAQLNEWRTRLGAAFAIDGVVSLDVDERANRVYVGVTDNETRDRVLALADELNVPRQAVVAAIDRGVVLATTLRDEVRPLVGGIKIGYVDGISRVCTLGVNVWYNNTAQGISGAMGFYTAAHCSTSYGFTDGTDFSQGSAVVAEERWDPPFFTNAEYSGCPVTKNCRWSDVAFAEYATGVNRTQGAIAYTTSRAFGIGQSGSIEIHPNQTTRTLTYTTLPVGGEYIDKVGQNTGWTSGTVTYTCRDYAANATTTILCQDEVAAGVDEGDSGSPAFKWTGQTTGAFAGIVWGKSNQTGGFIFSNIERIEDDMGNGVTYGPN